MAADRKFGSGSGAAGAVVPSSAVMDPPNVARALGLVDAGCLVSVSRSRDGGAVAVTVTFDSVWERQWFRSAADAAMQLDEWAGLIEDASPRSTPPASPDRRRRPR